LAGKISWSVEFVGLDAALLKLKAIDRTLASISRHQGTSMLGSGAGGAAGSGAGGSALGAAAGGAAGGAMGGASILAALEKSGFKQLPELLAKGLAVAHVSITKGFKDAVKRFGSQLELGLSDPQSEFSFYGKQGTGRNVPGFGSPPVIAPPKIDSVGGIGKPVGIFETIGKKISDVFDKSLKGVQDFGKTSTAGLQKTFGAIGKVITASGMPGSQAVGAMFTRLAGVGSKLGAWGMAITAVIIGLVIALKFLLKGVEEGARIFQEAAASGWGVKQTSQLEQALKAIGINEKPTYLMQAAASSGGQGMAGAARASGFGGAQQLQNVGKEFAAAMIDAASSARQMEQSAKANQIISADLVGIQREWKTLLAQSAASMYPILKMMMDYIKNWLKLINLYLEFWNWIKSKIPGLLPTGDPGKARWASGGGGGGMPNVTSWEKIGFTFGRGGTGEILNDIKKNTGETNKILEMSYEALKLMLKLGGAGASGAYVGAYLP